MHCIAHSSNLHRPILYLLSASLLTPVASRNLLLYQSLPFSIPNRHVILWRRKDDTGVGTTARGIVERLSGVPRRVPSDGGPSGRVRGALSTGAGNRGRATQRPSLPPGAVVALARQECRGHRNVRRGATTGRASIHWHRTLGPPAVDRGVGWTGRRSVLRTRWHHRL